MVEFYVISILGTSCIDEYSNLTANHTWKLRINLEDKYTLNFVYIVTVYIMDWRMNGGTESACTLHNIIKQVSHAMELSSKICGI